MRMKLLRTVPLALLAGLLPAVAMAEPNSGPHPWQMYLQGPDSPTMHQLTNFHNLLMWIITFIVVFVAALILYACWKFSEAKNPVPSRRSHNTVLEVVWTAVPVLILVIIAIPSFKLLYFTDVVPKTEMTVKAIGRQWYWSYEFPDQGNFTFDAYMVAASDLQPGQKRLLETDNQVVLPVGTNIRLQTTGGDVIHSWAMPALGVKVDAVPGRLNELWFNIDEPGIYYGQCSELCGVQHAFMPIQIKAVSREEFDTWVKEAQTKFARVGGEPPVSVANAPAATTPGVN